MTDLVSNYEKILARNKELSILQSTESIMHWDMETKMPPNGVNLRSLQLAQLSQIEHRLATARQIGILLERIEKHHDYTSLSELQRRNIHLIRKIFDEQTKIPEKLVTETERQRTLTVNVWKRAKSTRDFSLFRPELGKLFDLKKQAAEILMSVKKTSTPYDALIDIFEPKMTSDTIATVFEKLRKKLVTIIEKCSTSQKKPNTSFLRRKVPIDIQRKISDSLAEFIGYDVTSNKAGGRIDETEHPFTTGYFDDVRITTHYYEDNLESSIFSTLHEGGHAKYEQGFRKEWIYQPIGASPSYSFHESQSRFVENIVGRSTEFWKFYFPKLETLTGHVFSDINIHDFIRAVNLVEPSKIRIEADEVTYSLHIIIRFEIERALFDGKVKIDELPEIWNEKYNSYLGLKIQNDSEGVMQDTHWADGSFGYFPSYALGNIYSGQLLSRMTKDLSGWLEDIEKGSYQKVGDWLKKNIYSYGNLLDPTDLLKRITGQEINVDYYIRYLDSKYSELYGY